MNPAQRILVGLIRTYQCVLSPAKALVFGPLGRCRYTPTCSEYALQAVRTHGAVAGLWLAIKRLGRCHPWGGCGFDPVPPVHPANPDRSRGPITRAQAALDAFRPARIARGKI